MPNEIEVPTPQPLLKLAEIELGTLPEIIIKTRFQPGLVKSFVGQMVDIEAGGSGFTGNFLGRYTTSNEVNAAVNKQVYDLLKSTSRLTGIPINKLIKAILEPDTATFDEVRAINNGLGAMVAKLKAARTSQAHAWAEQVHMLIGSKNWSYSQEGEDVVIIPMIQLVHQKELFSPDTSDLGQVTKALNRFGSPSTRILLMSLSEEIR